MIGIRSELVLHKYQPEAESFVGRLAINRLSSLSVAGQMDFMSGINKAPAYHRTFEYSGVSWISRCPCQSSNIRADWGCYWGYCNPQLIV